GHAGERERLIAGDLTAAAHRDRGNAKAERIGGVVACTFEPIADGGQMSAGESAISERRAEQQQRSGDAGALGNLGWSGGQTAGPAATEEKPKTGLRGVLIAIGTRAIRLVNRRAEPFCR